MKKNLCISLPRNPHIQQLHFNIKSQSTSKCHANHDDGDGDDDSDGDNDDETKIILAVNIANNFQSQVKMWVTPYMAS